MEKSIKLQIIIFIVISLLLSFLFQKVPIEEQAELISILFQISTVIFAIFGIWIAVLNPTTILEYEPSKELTRRSKIAEVLFSELIITTIVFIATIILKFIVPLSKYWVSITAYNKLINASLGFFISLLFILQIRAIIGSLIPIFAIRISEKQNKKVQEMRSRR